MMSTPAKVEAYRMSIGECKWEEKCHKNNEFDERHDCYFCVLLDWTVWYLYIVSGKEKDQTTHMWCNMCYSFDSGFGLPAPWLDQNSAEFTCNGEKPRWIVVFED